jgi:hypothetical protein
MFLNAMESVEAVWHHDEGSQSNVEEYLLSHSISHCPLHVSTHHFNEVSVFNNWDSYGINEKEFIHQNRKHGVHTQQENIVITEQKRHQEPKQVNQVKRAMVDINDSEHF